MTLFDRSTESGEPNASAESLLPPGHVRIVLGLSYDGTAYHGFAPQPRESTVGGRLAEALAWVVGTDVKLTCAGRTDTGVHARVQVVHLDLDLALVPERLGLGEADPGTELPELRRSLDRQLGPDIAVWRATTAVAGFDARRSATSRRYRYDLDLGDHLDPLRRRATWRIGERLDLAPMRIATDPLLGEHDFAAFCRRPPDRPTGPITRRVLEATWTDRGEDLLRFEIEAKSFGHQMVRSIVGALVAVGRGRWRPSDVVALLRSGERTGAPAPAPPEGLCLVAVRYPPEQGGTWS